MRGRGAFQLAQMRHRDTRIIELCDHLRSAVDLIERIATEPIEPPPQAKPLPERDGSAVKIVETDKLAFSIREASKLLGIGRGTLYAAVNDGRLPAVKFGRRTLIPAKGLRDWLNSLPSRSHTAICLSRPC
jgi:excisionase family DNA binding protein